MLHQSQIRHLVLARLKWEGPRLVVKTNNALFAKTIYGCRLIELPYFSNKHQRILYYEASVFLQTTIFSEDTTVKEKYH
jgi:hypothetical protein